LKALEVFWQRCEGPVVFGRNDCCITLADTIMAAGGPDLMAGWRGRYRTEIGFRRIVLRAGFADVGEAARASFAQNGVAVEAPRDFDVALVSYHDRLDGPALSPGFYHSGLWNLRGQRGLVSLPGTAQAIYRVI
jgi:hypothetical protein